jgi:tetratricopeptide (TPR) repeat protein/predicted aspartyl protease
MNDFIGARRHAHWHRLLTGALLALGLQGVHAAEGHCAIRMLEMPVKMDGSRAVATVGINGTTVPLVVDTGAFFSMLNDAAAAQLKLKLHPLPFGMQIQGVAGRVEARATTVDHLQLLKGDLPDVDFVVGGNELEVGAMGLMGRNILGFTDTEYDLAHGVIRFIVANDDCAKANMAYWAGDTPVSEVELEHEFRQKSPAIRALVELNGHKMLALFDTGATTAVSLSAAHRAGVKDADMTPSAQVRGAGRGKVQSWTAPFDRVELGGEAVLHNRLSVADFELSDSDMLMGIDFFLSHRIYVSKKRSRMFFTYNGGPVFALNVEAPPAAAAAASGASAGVAPAEALTADEFARRGAASLARGDLAAALADLDRACAMEPGNAGFFAARAQVHMKQLDFDPTLADLDTALRLDPSQSTARMQRGWMRLSHGEPQRALEDLAELDKTLAPQAQLRAEMARLYGALGKPEQVIAQWTQWITAHPHDIALENARNGRCWARVELGIDLDKALDDCDDAVDADPKNPSYLDSRAWVYLRQGKLKKSLADFDRSLSIKRDGAWSLYGRGLVYLGLGDAARAKADLEVARKADANIDAQVKKAGLPSAPAVTP